MFAFCQEISYLAFYLFTSNFILLPIISNAQRTSGLCFLLLLLSVWFYHLQAFFLGSSLCFLQALSKIIPPSQFAKLILCMLVYLSCSPLWYPCRPHSLHWHTPFATTALGAESVRQKSKLQGMPHTYNGSCHLHCIHNWQNRTLHAFWNIHV